MTFPLDRMRELAAAGPVVRVVVAGTRGSVPREVGASMLVTKNGVEGTIGGGALELEAMNAARSTLTDRRDRFEQKPLGPSLGQCCGGAVGVLTEVWTIERLSAIDGEIVARPVPGFGPDAPLGVTRVLSTARSSGQMPEPVLLDGWMIEPVQRANRSIWVWGAGHVGRAIVGTLAPLPNVAISWADTGQERFPDEIAAGVNPLIAENPADLVSIAPAHAEHLVLTFSHALDLEICHRILGRPFRSLGLIGSRTKRTRFRSRLKALGHGSVQIDRMQCPIGDPTLGKHPQAIALGVATELLLRGRNGEEAMKEIQA